MGKTNFDDLELGVAGIEAREINSESATAGQVLTADGAGGAGWGPTARLRVRLSAAVSEEGVGSLTYRYRAGSTVAGVLSITQESTGFYRLVSASEDLAALFGVAYEDVPRAAVGTMVDEFNNGVLGWSVYLNASYLKVKTVSSATGGPADWNGAFELDLVA